MSINTLNQFVGKNNSLPSPDRIEEILLTSIWHEPLPEYGESYFNHLVSEFLALPPTEDGSQETKIIRDISSACKEKKLCWSHLYSFEKIILDRQPDERLRSRLTGLRCKYRSIVGEKGYNDYLNSNPPNAKELDLKVLKADMTQMLGDFHWAYMVTPACQQQRNRLNQNVAIISATAIILTLLAFTGGAYLRTGAFIIPSLAMVILMGILGGYVSVQRRIQNIPIEGDPLIEIFQLQKGAFSIWVAPVTAAIFAALLYLLFIGGLVKGSLFPAIPTPDYSGDNLLFGIFQISPGPMSGAEFAKLLVWSFIAGFAERFVPDTLDRLVGKNNGGDAVVTPRSTVTNSN